MQSSLTLAILDGTFAIHRLPPTAEVPLEILRQAVFSVTRTPRSFPLWCERRCPSWQTKPNWAGEGW